MSVVSIQVGYEGRLLHRLQWLGTAWHCLALWMTVDDRGMTVDDCSCFMAVLSTLQGFAAVDPVEGRGQPGRNQWDRGSNGAHHGHTMGTPPKKSCMIEEKCGEIDEFVVGQRSCNHNMKYVEFWFLVWSLLLSAEIHMPRLLGLRKLSLCVGKCTLYTFTIFHCHWVCSEACVGGTTGTVATAPPLTSVM